MDIFEWFIKWTYIWGETITFAEDLHTAADDINYDDFIWMIYNVNMYQVKMKRHL